MGSSTGRKILKRAEQKKQLPRLLLVLQHWNEPLSIFAGTRFGLAVLATLAGILFPAVARGGTAPYTPPALNRWLERLLGVWSHWDGEWYLYIAQSGYRPGEPTPAFFPLYPLLVKLFSYLCLGNYLLAGVVVSAAAMLASFLLFFELARRDFGRRQASLAVLYLAAFPTAFFLAAIYSESLFLALALGAFLAGRHYRNWLLAGLLLALATLTRSLGILLVLPLAWEWLQQQTGFSLGFRNFKINLKQPLNLRGAALLIGLPLLALAAWLFFNALTLGDPLAFVKIQSDRTWNRRSALPWETIARGFNAFFASRGPDGFLPPAAREDPNLLDFPFFVFFGLLFLAACRQSWKGLLPFSYLLYFGLGFLLPLLSPTPKEPLLSFPRFGLVLFPAFMLLASWGEKQPWLHYLYLLGALLLQGLFFSRFANWYWIA